MNWPLGLSLLASLIAVAAAVASKGTNRALFAVLALGNLIIAATL